MFVNRVRLFVNSLFATLFVNAVREQVFVNTVRVSPNLASPAPKVDLTRPGPGPCHDFTTAKVTITTERPCPTSHENDQGTSLMIFPASGIYQGSPYPGVWLSCSTLQIPRPYR